MAERYAESLDQGASKAANAMGRGVTTVVGDANAAKAIAIASAVNARAEAATAALAARGTDYCRVVKKCWDIFATFFARHSILVFVCSLLAFCLACGLMSVTVTHDNFEKGGFGPTYTLWREFLNSFVIIATIFSWHAIFLRHQTVLKVMGSIITYSAAALFVVASFDKDFVDTYCVNNTLCISISAINATTVINWNPFTPGNISAVPVLDYFCVLFWLIAGLILHKRGEIISDELKEAQTKAELYSEMQAAAAFPPGEVEAQAGAPPGAYTGASLPSNQPGQTF
jgi:hypothetical protein